MGILLFMLLLLCSLACYALKLLIMMDKGEVPIGFMVVNEILGHCRAEIRNTMAKRMSFLLLFSRRT